MTVTDPAALSPLPRRLLLAGAGMLAASALTFASLPSRAADLLTVAQARGTLRVGMEGSYPPFSFIDPATGQMTGYDAGVANLLVAQLGLKLELVPTEWVDMFAGLAAGKYDVIISQVIITPKRLQLLDFSEPYTYSQAQLLLRKYDTVAYTSLAALKGKTVGVAKGSNYETQVLAVPGIKVRSYPAAPENLQDLAFGRIDAVLNDSLMVAYLLRQSALPIKPGPMVGSGERIGVAFRKGNPQLKAAINRALAQAHADGSLTRLARKWFAQDASRPPAQRP
jgi:cystine transport system substrate-binding protein